MYRFEADLTEVVPVGIVPEGIRLDAYFSGQVVEGPLSGATLRGIDYFLLRSDGVGVVDAYELISTVTDQHVSTHAQGYIMVSTSVFEHKEAEEETNWKAGEFTAQHIASLVPNPPQITAGEVVAHKAS